MEEHSFSDPQSTFEELCTAIDNLSLNSGYATSVKFLCRFFTLRKLTIEEPPSTVKFLVEAWSEFVDLTNEVLKPQYNQPWLMNVVLVHDILSRAIWYLDEYQRIVPTLEDISATAEEAGVSVDALKQAWSVPQLLSILVSVAANGGFFPGRAPIDNASPHNKFAPIHYCFGYFAALTAARLLSKVGDFGGCLDMVKPLDIGNDSNFPFTTPPYITAVNFISYALIMSHRASEVPRLISRCYVSGAIMKSLDSIFGEFQFHQQKQYARLHFLAFIAYAISPETSSDMVFFDRISDVFSNHFNSLSNLKIETFDFDTELPPAGESLRSGVHDSNSILVELSTIFKNISPSFINPAPFDAGSSSIASINEYQKKLFFNEIFSRVGVNSITRVRNILPFYTTSALPALSTAVGISEEDIKSFLIAIKLKGLNVSQQDDDSSATVAILDPLHFYVDKDVIQIEEVRDSANVMETLLRYLKRGVQRPYGSKAYSQYKRHTHHGASRNAPRGNR